MVDVATSWETLEGSFPAASTPVVVCKICRILFVSRFLRSLRTPCFSASFLNTCRRASFKMKENREHRIFPPNFNADHLPFRTTFNRTYFDSITVLFYQVGYTSRRTSILEYLSAKPACLTCDDNSNNSSRSKVGMWIFANGLAGGFFA